MTDGILAGLPQLRQDWSEVRLGGLATRSREDGRPDLQSLSVFLDGGVVPRADRSAANHNRLGADLAPYLVVRPGDLVFNKLRTWQGGFGHSRYEGIVSPAYFVLRPHDADARFLDYLLHSAPYLQELTRRSKWMPPSQFDIAWIDLKTLPIRLPAQVEQHRIADFLDEETARIDALILAKQRMCEVLAETRSATIGLGVVGGLGAPVTRRSYVPWAAELPEHWGEAKLTLVARLGSGHTPSRSRPDWWVDTTVPWITTGEVAQMRSDRIETILATRERVSELGIANSSAEVHPAGTVVLCRTAASAGYSAIMGTDMAVSQDIATWTCGPLLRPRYLLLCLRAMRQDLLGRLAMGSTHKTIYMPDIESIRIPLPAVVEQDSIVEEVWARLHRIDAITDTLTRQIELLRERRQALITAAVTGELEI